MSLPELEHQLAKRLAHRLAEATVERGARVTVEERELSPGFGFRLPCIVVAVDRLDKPAVLLLWVEDPDILWLGVSEDGDPPYATLEWYSHTEEEIRER